MRPAAFLLGLVALTGAAAFLWGRRRHLPMTALWWAVGRGLDCVGLWMIFYAANVGLGVAGALLLRFVNGPFVSVYWVLDVTLALLSLGQAVVFQGWRDAAHHQG